MKYSFLEVFTGIIVLIIAVAVVLYSLKIQNVSNNKDSYIVTGSCVNAEGITRGSDILISGIKIGYVEDMSLDTQNYTASIKMRLYQKIPQDSYVSISGIGLFSSKYLNITTGASDIMITPNDVVDISQGMSLEGIIGKMVSSAIEKD